MFRSKNYKKIIGYIDELVEMEKEATFYYNELVDWIHYLRCTETICPCEMFGYESDNDLCFYSDVAEVMDIFCSTNCPRSEIYYSIKISSHYMSFMNVYAFLLLAERLENEVLPYAIKE